MIKDLRILHVLSPVKWDGDTFNCNADSNWKVCEKTINFLPDCHHYILVPLKHNIQIQQDNVSYIRYDYPKSVQLNRGIFDYRKLIFDFTRLDIDFVFNHQPEICFNIQQWFHTQRYFPDMKIFNFYHWIDCKESRGSVQGCPSFYMRQLEAMHISSGNFIHCDLSLEYLKSNFVGFDAQHLISKVYQMPLSSKIDVEPTHFDLPDKKILLFNHRWNESSGIKKLIEYSENLPKEYLIWITDERCDVKNDKFIIKHLSYSDYAYLVKKCYASLCFIDGYSTWNLSIQDSLLMGRPLLYFEHPTIKKVVGEDYNGYFQSKEQFFNLLNKLPEIKTDIINEHDFIFEIQLKGAITEHWKDTRKAPKDAPEWIKNIENGITDKKSIANRVNSKVRLNGTAHYIRRYLLHNGIRDNVNKSHTEYFIEGNEKTIKQDLFSNVK